MERLRIRPAMPVSVPLAVLCLALCATAASRGNLPMGTDASTAASSQDGAEQKDPIQDRPRRVKPPRTPREQGFRFVATVGINGLEAARYNYQTTITMPDGRRFIYSGPQSSPGGNVLAGIEITPPGALRRFSAGLHVNGGGLQSWSRPVTPTDSSVPFSVANLQLAIQNSIGNSSGWRPGFSPFVEHELGNLLGNRLRVGYEYWRQTGGYKGHFFPSDVANQVAQYDVRLSYSSHLAEFSFSNFTNLDDSDVSLPGVHHSRRRYGVVQKLGILGGSHGTVMIFIAVGPFWSF